MASRVKRPWDRLEYQRIVSAAYRDGDVVVMFADGEEARVSPGHLVSDVGPKPDWPRLRTEDFHLIVPSANGDVEIPWDVIRIHSDPTFDAFWQELVAGSAVAHPTSRTG